LAIFEVKFEMHCLGTMQARLSMKQLKNKLLAISNRIAATRKEHKRKLIGLQQAGFIGVLYHIEREQCYEELTGFVKGLTALQKKISVLTYTTADISMASSLRYPSFTRQGIGLTGQITDKDVESFVSSAFDILYCIQKEPLDVFDTILLNTKAHCRVGNHIKGKEELFELMICPQPDHSITSQLLHYTQLIN
jgi:hypothetical protein